MHLFLLPAQLLIQILDFLYLDKVWLHFPLQQLKSSAKFPIEGDTERKENLECSFIKLNCVFVISLINGITSKTL